MTEIKIVDLLIVGGGINGAGIARDAAGRGLKVLLAEARDLGAATSSASSKLIHGGLRYLEQYEFRLVRESLAEREVLWSMAPHLISPLRFVLPVHSGLRPAWLLRLGLFLYDHIGGRERLPGTKTRRRGDAAMTPLAASFAKGFEYSDCWVDDARLVVANAIDAAENDAEILVGWSAVAAERVDGLWLVKLQSDDGKVRQVSARSLVNAGGPWVEQVLGLAGGEHKHAIKLVKGSHIVVPRLHDQACAFTLQNADGRIVFVIPYLDRYSLIGTTDVVYRGDPAAAAIASDEIGYLCEIASGYLAAPVRREDVVWSYAGVRPLLDDGGANASKVTRDYLLDIDRPDGKAPLLSIFGGKITTFRRLAEHALSELLPLLDEPDHPWTRGAVLPGGDIGDFAEFCAAKQRRFANLDPALLRRMCAAYGSRIDQVLADGLGAQIAPGVFEAELRHMREHEWARSAEDALLRRSKLGVGLGPAEWDQVRAWLRA